MPSPNEAPLARPIVLDTNALLLPFRERFPLEEALLAWGPRTTWVVPTPVWTELQRLATGGTAEARGAMEWSQSLPRRIVRGEGDDAVLALARRLNAWVVTADRALQRRLRDAGLDVLVPSGRSKLVLRPAFRTATSRRGRSRSQRVIKTAPVHFLRRR